MRGFLLTLRPEMILKSFEAVIERSYTKVLFCNCAQNIAKEVTRFLVKLQKTTCLSLYEHFQGYFTRI